MTKYNKIKVSFIFFCILIALIAHSLDINYIALSGILLAGIIILFECVRAFAQHKDTIGD